MAASLLVPVLVAGGGIAYVAAQAEPPAPLPGPSTQLAPTGGSTIQGALVQVTSTPSTSTLDSLTSQLAAIDKRLAEITTKLYGAGVTR